LLGDRLAGVCEACRPVPGVRAAPGWRRRAASALGLAEVFQDRFERVDDLVARGAALVEAELEVERLGGRPEGEYIVLRAARFRLGGRFADLLAGGAPLAGDLLDQGGHFLWCILPNHLEKQRLR